MATDQVTLLRRNVKIACVQLASTNDKDANINLAREKVLAAAGNGAGIIVLPECFNSPYSTTSFPKCAEILQPSPPEPDVSPTYHALSKMAQDCNAYVIGGSIPEFVPSSNKHYSTTLVFSPQGNLLGSHRKAHLFDVEFPDMTFRESDVLSQGDAITVLELEEYGKIGLGICFDIRFPEMSAVAARQGAFALIYPSAFNSTTGPLHWEILARSRALDNQVFVAMCSQSYEPTSGYSAWGHSMVVDPSGQIMATLERDEGIVYADLSNDAIQVCRRQIPLTSQRRFGLYSNISKS